MYHVDTLEGPVGMPDDPEAAVHEAASEARIRVLHMYNDFGQIFRNVQTEVLFYDFYLRWSTYIHLCPI